MGDGLEPSTSSHGHNGREDNDDSISQMKKKQKQKPFSTKDKQIILNVYNYIRRKKSKEESAAKTAELLMISKRSVYRYLKEYRENKHFRPPEKPGPKKPSNVKVNKSTVSTMKGQTPTCIKNKEEIAKPITSYKQLPYCPEVKKELKVSTMTEKFPYSVEFEKEDLSVSTMKEQFSCPTVNHQQIKVYSSNSPISSCSKANQEFKVYSIRNAPKSKQAIFKTERRTVVNIPKPHDNRGLPKIKVFEIRKLNP